MTRHQIRKPNILISAPQWHVINVNQESDMQRWEAEINKPLRYQNPYLIAYLAKAVKSQRRALRYINEQTGIFN